MGHVNESMDMVESAILDKDQVLLYSVFLSFADTLRVLPIII